MRHTVRIKMKKNQIKSMTANERKAGSKTCCYRKRGDTDLFMMGPLDWNEKSEDKERKKEEEEIFA